MAEPTPDPTPARPDAPTTWKERVELLTAGADRPSSPVLLAVAVAVALALVAFVVLRPSPPPPPELAMPLAGSSSTTIAETAPAEVVVHVAGAVAAPGVYRLPTDARVADAVDAAGGPAPGADLDRLNLASPVADGSQVYVPSEGEPLPAGGAAGAQPAGEAGAGALVDLNTATLADLEALPGIGPATAQAILDAREKAGRFTSVDDLLDVRGIGPAKLEALRDLVTVTP